jgi:hypothetical protein
MGNEAKKIDNQQGNEVLPCVSTRLELGDFTINPIDKDGDFEIEIDSSEYVWTYMSKENAVKLAQYILGSVNGC